MRTVSSRIGLLQGSGNLSYCTMRHAVRSQCACDQEHSGFSLNSMHTPSALCAPQGVALEPAPSTRQALRASSSAFVDCKDSSPSSPSDAGGADGWFTVVTPGCTYDATVDGCGGDGPLPVCARSPPVQACGSCSGQACHVCCSMALQHGPCPLGRRSSRMLGASALWQRRRQIAVNRLRSRLKPFL